MHWYFLVLKKYGSCQGRASRAEYWIFGLLHSIFIILSYFLVFICFLAHPKFGFLTLILWGIFVVATIPPCIAVSIRRLHDTNKSGWYFLVNFVPIIGSLIFLFFMLQKGDFQRNDYNLDDEFEDEEEIEDIPHSRKSRSSRSSRTGTKFAAKQDDEEQTSTIAIGGKVSSYKNRSSAENDLDDMDDDYMPPEPKKMPIPTSVLWFAASVFAHVFLLVIAFLFGGNPPPQKEVKISLNTKIHREVREEIKPEPKPDIFKTEKVVETTDADQEQIEDPVIKEDTKVADHNETANEEDFHASKGTAEGMSDNPLEGKAIQRERYESELGVGGGAGGMFGDRFGGRENLSKRGGSQQTESAVQLGLQWLKRHQNPNGSWSANNFTACCGKDSALPGLCSGTGHPAFDPGLTGLALLCFLGAGNSTNLGEFKDQVKNGVRYLMSIQEEEGCFGPRAGHYMYNHAIATLAIAEAYTLSNYNPMLKNSAQKGVDFLVAAQNPNQAWRYTYRCGDNDTSVSGWCIMALKSAKVGGLFVPDTAFQSAKNYLNEMTDDYYYTGYTQKGKQFVNIAECMTAVAMTARVFMGAEAQDANLIGGAGLLQTSLPAWDAKAGAVREGQNMIDFYYWYYGTLAMFQMGGNFWTTWNEKMKDVLVANQCREGCSKGSWPTEDRWSTEGGRVYTTAINVLSLEIYYRYAKVFK